MPTSTASATRRGPLFHSFGTLVLSSLLTLLVPARPAFADLVTGQEDAALELALKHLRDGSADACLNIAGSRASAASAPAVASGNEWPGLMAACFALAGDSRQAETWLAKSKSEARHPYSSVVRALSAARSGAWPQAEAEARKALAKDPSATAALQVLGQAHIHRQHSDSADACYRKILAVAPRHAAAHTALGGLHLAKRETAPAFEHFLAAVAERPKEVAARTGIGLIYQSLGMVKQAEGAFAAALAQDAAYLPAALGLAETRLFDNDPKAAIAALEKFAKTSKDRRVQVLLAEASFRAGRFDAALAYHRVADPAGKDPGALHGRAMAQLAKKDFKASLASLDAALAVAPQSSSYRLTRGVVLSQLGRSEEAKADFAKSRGLAPVAPLADFAEAMSQLSAKNFPEAAGAMSRAVEALPGFLPGSADWKKQMTAAHAGGALEVQRAFLLLRNLQGTAPRADLEALASREADNLLVHYLLGKALRLEGEAAKAAQAFETAARLDPAFLPAQLELAKLHTDAKEYPKAVARYEAIQAADPKGRFVAAMQVETYLGVLKEKMGDPAKALVHYRRGLELAPDNAYLHNQAGWALGLLKDYAAARVHLGKAVALEPKALAYADNLGWIQYLAKDYPAALKSLQAAEAKGYKDPSLAYHLGMAHHRLGNAKESKKHLEQALALSSEFPGAEEARKTLAAK